MPTQLQHLGKKLAWLIAILFLLCALLVSIGRIVLSYTEDYQAEIVQQLADALGKPVTVEWLSGNWRGLYPQLQARHVTIGKSQSLALKQVSLDIRPFASLFSGQLKLAKVRLEGVQLAFVEDQQQNWRVLGLPEAKEDEADLSYSRVVAYLEQLGQVEVLDSRFAFFPYQAGPVVFKQANLAFHQGYLSQQLEASLSLPDDTQLQFKATGKLHATEWQQSALRFYLASETTDWASWLPIKQWQGWRLAQAELGLQLWGEARDGWLQQASVQLAAEQLQLITPQAQQLEIERPELVLFYQKHGEQAEVWLESLKFPLPTAAGLPVAKPYQLQALIRYEPESEGPLLRLQIPEVDLPAVNRWVLAFLPQQQAAYEIVKHLNFQGQLQQLWLEWRPEHPELAKQLSFSSAVKDLSYSAWEHVPSASGINGTVHGTALNGELRLDTQAFSLHLAELFPQPWQYQQARAQLTWLFDEQGFELTSPYLQVQGPEGQIAGDFVIRLFDDPALEDYMDLRVGLVDGKAAFTAKYLPTRAPGFSQELGDWLKSAIVAGQVEQGYFQYQGAISQHQDKAASEIGLYFKVRDAELAYQPGWPALTQAEAEVLVDGSQVVVELAQGKILNTRVTDAVAEVPLATGAPQLRLSAKLDSSMQDGLAILQQTPLAEDLSALHSWQGSGPLPATLNLAVPLDKQAPPLQVVVDFQARQAELNLVNLGVPLTQVNGDFRYDLQQGLSAKRVAGRVFNQPFTGEITAQRKAQQAHTLMRFNGKLPVSTLLTWGGLDSQLPVAGQLPYNLAVNLQGADANLELTSNLEGVSLDLPAPFAKSNKQTRATQLQIQLPAQGTPSYQLQYANVLSANARVPNHQLGQLRARVKLGGGKAGAPTVSGISLEGQLAEVQLEQWQALFERFSQGQVANTGNATPKLSTVNLSTPRFSGLGMSRQPLSLQLRPQANHSWLAQVDSPLLKGSLRYYENNHQPHQITLSQLTLPRPADTATSQKQDALAGINPKTIPSMDVSIQQLNLGSQPLGTLRFKARKQTHGLRLLDIASNLQGLSVHGQLDWLQPAKHASSSFRGQLQGADIGKVLNAFGFAKTISSKQFFAVVNGRWSGSPAALGTDSFTGDIDARFSQGQLKSVEGNAQAVRVFGLLNFETIGRRLRLDFSDIFDRGLAYDTIKARLRADNGLFKTVGPLVMDGPATDLQLEGFIDFPRDKINAQLRVSVPLTSNLTIAAIAAGAPLIGGAVYLADKALGNRLEKLTAVRYRITGAWSKPTVRMQ